MPPKKDDKEKKKPKKVEAPKLAKGTGPSSTEITLRLELESLERELATARLETDTARRQNEWLRSELKVTEDEIAHYEKYMTSKAAREQMKIQSLNDRNADELDRISADRRQQEEMFNRQKLGASGFTSAFIIANKLSDLREQIMQRQNELSKVKRQLDELSDYKTKREAQEQEMKALEGQLVEMERNHLASESVSQSEIYIFPQCNS